MGAIVRGVVEKCLVSWAALADGDVGCAVVRDVEVVVLLLDCDRMEKVREEPMLVILRDDEVEIRPNNEGRRVDLSRGDSLSVLVGKVRGGGKRR